MKSTTSACKVLLGAAAVAALLGACKKTETTGIPPAGTSTVVTPPSTMSGTSATTGTTGTTGYPATPPPTTPPPSEMPPSSAPATPPKNP